MLVLKSFRIESIADKLMGRIAKRIEDKRLLKLIRTFLNAGVMENGLVSPSGGRDPTGWSDHSPYAKGNFCFDRVLRHR